MTPVDVLTAMAATLAAKFPTVPVTPHGGRFTERELPLLLAKAPCLLVSCLSIGSLSLAGPDRWRGDAQWGVYVLGAESPTTPRDQQALNLTYSLLTFIPDQRWGLEEARLPDLDRIAADNLYTGYSNTLRVALWGVAWSQTFTFDLI